MLMRVASDTSFATRKESAALKLRNFAVCLKRGQEAYAKRKLTATVLVHHLQGMLDWLERDEVKPLSAAVTWPRLVERAERWHRDLAHRRLNALATQQGVLVWNGVLDGVLQSGNLTAEELTSNEALMLEGTRMGHCVGGYGPYCVNGRSRIFSLRRGPEQVATLELRRDPPSASKPRSRAARWHITQLYGFGNEVVRDMKLKAFASMVCSSASRYRGEYVGMELVGPAYFPRAVLG